MAIVTNTTRRVEIPHEPGEWMELKRLSWRQLELAKDVASSDALKRIKSVGGDMMIALQKYGNEQKKGKDRDPASQYDRGIVLEAGVAGWSYDAELKKESIDALDEETAEWAFREILSLNKPRSEEEQKNA